MNQPGQPNQQQQFPGANYRAPMDEISEVIMWPPKIVQCIQVFNGEEFITPVLRSIYDAVDHIRVVEGAVANQVDMTDDGHSTDRTVELINDFISKEDKDGKVHLIQKDRPFKHLEEMKQTFLDHAVRGEWLLINDVDEFYKPEDIKLLRKAIEYQPTASEFVPLFLHFYRDCTHIAKPGPEWQPQHQRFIRFVPGLKYNSHPVATDANGLCTYFDPRYQPKRFMIKNWYVWHYGYARQNMDKIMNDKQEYYAKELKKHGGANKPFDEKTRIFLGRMEKPEDFCTYPISLHPEILQDHPMLSRLDKTWADQKFTQQSWDTVEPYCLDQIPNIWLWMTGINTRMPFFSNQITFKELGE
jgi:hypothetical protein